MTYKMLKTGSRSRSVRSLADPRSRRKLDFFEMRIGRIPAPAAMKNRKLTLLPSSKKIVGLKAVTSG